LESPDHKIKITTLSNGDTITEYADGKEKEVYEWENGDTETTYRRGEKRSDHYDATSGATVTEFRNGDKKIQHKDGTIEAEFAEGEIKKQIRFAEPKVTRTEFRDGPVVSQDVLPDGTIMKIMKDNSHVVEKTDGTTTEIKEDGTLTVRDKNGKVIERGTFAILEGGVKLTEYETGQKIWVWQDGTKITEFAAGDKESMVELTDGRVRTKFR